MVRSVSIQTEGIIALSLFITFLTFYLFLLNYNIKSYTNPITNYRSYLDNIYYNISNKTFYILKLNISIPYSTYIFCSKGYIDSQFCQSFSMFYPYNISQLINYNGVLNGTFNSIFSPRYGFFFYSNFSNPIYCEINKNYVLVEIYNPNNVKLSNVQVFISDPTIYYWLLNGYYLSVKDLNGYSYDFCYMKKDFYCDNIVNGAYGIWVKIKEINSNSSIILNITPSSYNYAKDGGKVFLFYDHFNYNSKGNFNSNWDVSVEYNFSTTNEGVLISSNSANVQILSKDNQNLEGNYLILYKVNATCKYVIFRVPTYLPSAFYINKNKAKNSSYYSLSFTSSSNLNSINITSICGQGSTNTIQLDYIIALNYSSSLIPLVSRVIDYPKCYYEYNFILADRIFYKTTIYTSEYSFDYDILKYYNSSLKLLYYSDTVFYNLALLDRYNLSSEFVCLNQTTTKKCLTSAFFNYKSNNGRYYAILFGNSRWFIGYYENYSSVNNLEITKWGEDGYIGGYLGYFLLEPFNYYIGGYLGYFLLEPFNYYYGFNNIISFSSQYFPYIHKISSSSYSVFFFKDYPIITYLYNKKIDANVYYNTTKNPWGFMYIFSESDLNLAYNGSLMFSLPNVEDIDIQSCNGNYLSYFQNLNYSFRLVNLGIGKVPNNYTYSAIYPICIFNESSNKLIKDNIIIYS